MTSVSIIQQDRKILRDTDNPYTKVLVCEYQATTQGDLKRHKQAIHEGVKYACDQCEYHATDQRNLKKHKQSSVSIRQRHKEILRDTNKLFTKVSNTFVTSVTIRQHNSFI